MRSGLAFFFPCIYVFAAITMHAQTSIRFRATVRAGESYTHHIGHGLYFALDQLDGGTWNFQVKSLGNNENYTNCLGSPVMHGPATVDLSAWRFAPDADAGWAEHVPTKKQFSFVTNAADQKYECAEFKAIYDSFQRAQSKGEEDYSGLPHYKPRRTGQGSVVVTSVALKPGLNKEHAEFEKITLYVKIRFPGNGKASEH